MGVVVSGWEELADGGSGGVMEKVGREVGGRAYVLNKKAWKRRAEQWILEPGVSPALAPT